MIANHANDSSKGSSVRDGALLRPITHRDDPEMKSEDIAPSRPRGRPRSPSFVRTNDQHTRPDARTHIRRRDPGFETSSGNNPPVETKNKSPVRNKNDNSQPRNDDQLSPLRSRKNEVKSMTKSKAVGRRRMSSFQGIGIVKKKGNNVESIPVDPAKVEKMRGERRLKSVDIMRKSAKTDQIRNILEETLDECMKQTEMKQNPEEKIQTVMTKAKEQGMSTNEIFSFFNGGNPNTTKITKATFLATINKLGNSVQHITEEELDVLIGKFDKNGDGQICIDEFKNYCYYQINSVAWKAERSRLEASGEMQKIKAQLSRRFTANETESDDCSDEVPCGDEAYRTSKFFWKSNNNVEIRVYFTGKMNVITVQLYSQTFEKELPTIYVCKNKLDSQYEGVVETLNSLEHKESDEHKAPWKLISEYIVARLQLKNGPKGDIVEDNFPIEECSHIPKEAMIVPCVCKLKDDAYDTLMIPKPLNLGPPPPITSSDTITDSFDKKMKSFYNVQRKARLSRRSAEDLSNVVSTVLSDVNDLSIDLAS